MHFPPDQDIIVGWGQHSDSAQISPHWFSFVILWVHSVECRGVKPIFMRDQHVLCPLVEFQIPPDSCGYLTSLADSTASDPSVWRCSPCYDWCIVTGVIALSGVTSPRFWWSFWRCSFFNEKAEIHCIEAEIRQKIIFKWTCFEETFSRMYTKQPGAELC